MDGTPFGRYRLVELLGRGGMGEVWRAYDTETNNRTVAIKLLPPHLAGDDMFVQRFRREADAAARLNNPHVIPIHTYGEIDGRLFVDMRLVEGRNLQEVLAGGPLEPGRAVRIVEQVAKALQAAHRTGLVHRDVKPSNILVDEDDFAYLIDFGIARSTDQTGLTNTGAMIGSYHYMAPERFRAHEADARADIYALACVLYECLTGSRPFPGDSMESQVAGHLTDPPPQPSTAQPKVPAQFDAVIAKGMAKEPDNRYATTVELADAARDAITVPILRSTPSPAPSPATEQTGTATSTWPPHNPPPADPTLPATVQQQATEFAHQPTEPAATELRSQPTPPRPAGGAAGQPRERPPGTAPKGRSRTPWIIAGVAVAVVLVAAGIGINAIIGNRPSPSRTAPKSQVAPTQSVAPTSATPSVPGAAFEIDIAVDSGDYTCFAHGVEVAKCDLQVSPGAEITVFNNDVRTRGVNWDHSDPETSDLYVQPNLQRTFTAPHAPGNYPFHDKTAEPTRVTGNLHVVTTNG